MKIEVELGEIEKKRVHNGSFKFKVYVASRVSNLLKDDLHSFTAFGYTFQDGAVRIDAVEPNTIQSLPQKQFDAILFEVRNLVRYQIISEEFEKFKGES